MYRFLTGTEKTEEPDHVPVHLPVRCRYRRAQRTGPCTGSSTGSVPVQKIQGTGPCSGSCTGYVPVHRTRETGPCTGTCIVFVPVHGAPRNRTMNRYMYRYRTGTRDLEKPDHVPEHVLVSYRYMGARETGPCTGTCTGSVPVQNRLGADFPLLDEISAQRDAWRQRFLCAGAAHPISCVGQAQRGRAGTGRRQKARGGAKKKGASPCCRPSAASYLASPDVSLLSCTTGPSSVSRCTL